MPNSRSKRVAQALPTNLFSIRADGIPRRNASSRDGNRSYFFSSDVQFRHNRERRGRRQRTREGTRREDLDRSAALLKPLTRRSPHIAHRRLAEESAVFPIELARAFVADFEGGACCVHSIVQHPFSGHMQSQLFLELQRAHRGQRTE
jgi:hypothetical protein